jgi:hypothetical protein
MLPHAKEGANGNEDATSVLALDALRTAEGKSV